MGIMEGWGKDQKAPQDMALWRGLGLSSPYPTHPPTSNLFSGKFGLRRSLKEVVCSSIFRPFGGGSHVKTPPRKGLGPAGYCKDRKLCLRWPASRSLEMTTSLATICGGSNNFLHHLLLVIGMDFSQGRDGSMPRPLNGQQECRCGSQASNLPSG